MVCYLMIKKLVLKSSKWGMNDDDDDDGDGKSMATYIAIIYPLTFPFGIKSMCQGVNNFILR